MKLNLVPMLLISVFSAAVQSILWVPSSFAGDCTIAVGGSADNYLSTHPYNQIEKYLAKELERKGYSVNREPNPTYSLSADIVCVIDGQPAAELACSDSLRLDWTLENLKTGEVLSHGERSYRWYALPKARARRKIREWIDSVPGCIVR